MHTRDERAFVILAASVNAMVEAAVRCAGPRGYTVTKGEREVLHEITNETGGWIDVTRAPDEAVVATIGRIAHGFIDGSIPVVWDPENNETRVLCPEDMKDMKWILQY